MNRIFAIILSAVLLMCCAVTNAQVRFRYDTGLDYFFNNMEYDRSGSRFEKSGTTHGVRLAPAVGAGFQTDSGRVKHSVMLGVDIMVQMGEQLKVADAFKELLIYYGADVALSNGGTFSAKAGIFPRSFLKGRYIGAVYDKNNWFLDSNVEGMLFQYGGGRVNAELGLDWMGMFADEAHPERRERFRIFSSGSWRFYRSLSLGWTGSFYHFACSLKEQNVVDNHLLQAWIGWNPSMKWLDKLDIELGGIITYQWDRAVEGAITTPGGLVFSQMVSKWNVYLGNSFYWGADLMPMYDTYGSELYQGRMSYHTGYDTASCTDRLAISYMPRIGRHLSLFVTAAFNFGTPSQSLGIPFYRGCQQICGLRVYFDNK